MRLSAQTRAKSITTMPAGDSLSRAIRPRIDPKMARRVRFVNIRALSRSNAGGGQHWKFIKLAKEHRSRTLHQLASETLPPLPVNVTLTRFAPRECDDDNLRGALKACRDGVADSYGIDDADPRIHFDYGQEIGKVWGVEVRIVAAACHAQHNDGDCTWKECPQSRDGEPQKSGRTCPLPWGERS